MIIEATYTERDWYGVVLVDGVVLDAKRSQRLRNHSPDGFAWGYSGSGPAQLALAILLHAGITERIALALYQRFKARFIAPLPPESFKLDVDVVGWAAEHEQLAIVYSHPEDIADGQR